MFSNESALYEIISNLSKIEGFFYFVLESLVGLGLDKAAHVLV
jgi:hypothetical protein